MNKRQMIKIRTLLMAVAVLLFFVGYSTEANASRPPELTPIAVTKNLSWKLSPNYITGGFSSDAPGYHLITFSGLSDACIASFELRVKSTTYPAMINYYVYKSETDGYDTRLKDGTIIMSDSGYKSFTFDWLPYKQGSVYLLMSSVDSSTSPTYTVSLSVEEHQFGYWNTTRPPTCIDSGREERTCTRCEKKEARPIGIVDHIYDEGTVTTAPNCLRAGTKTYTCTVCGDEKTESIAALGHNYVEGDIIKAPTCGVSGQRKDICQRCGAEKTVTLSPTGNHSYGDWTVTEDPTCVASGKKTATCTVCGRTKTEAIAATGIHSCDDWTVTTEPTCGAAGEKTGLCNVCGAEVTETIAATGEHVYGDWTVIKEPTCSEKGKKKGVCSVCGDEKTIEIDTLDHSPILVPFKAPTTGNDGSIEYGNVKHYECENCGNYFTDEDCQTQLQEDDVFIGLNAHGCGNSVYWTIKDNTLYIFGQGTMSGSNPWNSYGDQIERVVFDEKTSVKIGSSAFRNCKCLTSITIPDGVSYIGENAFYGCSSLGSVEIPDSVTSVGGYAFCNCSGLTSIEIPNHVTSIGDYAFYGCNSLGSVEIPDSVTSVGGYAFCNCSGLTSIETPNRATGFGNRAFSGCSSLTTIKVYADNADISRFFGAASDIPTSLKTIVITGGTKIKNGAFSGGTGLTSIDLSNSVTDIGGSAFSGCTGLTSIEIPNSVATIGNSAFSGCTGLTSVVIPDGVKDISNAFSGCTGLTSVEIPSSATTIKGAFYGCSGLTSIEIPENVQDISDAFSGCSGLTTIQIPDGATNVKGAFSGCSGLTTIQIPDGIQDISNTFSGCTGLTSVEIPSSVTTINEAFSGCTGLTSVDLPSSMTTIGYNAFSGCSRLSSIQIPNSTKHICVRAFSDCTSLTDLYLPKQVRSIAKNAFKGDTITLSYNCSYSGSDYDDSGDWEGWSWVRDSHDKNEAWDDDPWTSDYEGNVTLKLLHNSYKVDRVESTCTEEGHTEYWYCERCTKSFRDQEGTNVIEDCDEWGNVPDSCVIPALGHSFSDSYTIEDKATRWEFGYKYRKCERCDETTDGEEIANIGDVRLSATAFTYNGKVRKPTIKITDFYDKTIAPSNYTLTNKGGKNVGTYTVKVTFKNEYSGSWSETYKINPKGTTILAPASARKGFTAKWKKQSAKMSTSRITGYQIRYSLKSSMASAKTVKVKGYAKTSKKITKLKAKKKYYVQVRTYKTVSGKTYYSPWSAKKTVTTKK